MASSLCLFSLNLFFTTCYVYALLILYNLLVTVMTPLLLPCLEVITTFLYLPCSPTHLWSLEVFCMLHVRKISFLFWRLGGFRCPNWFSYFLDGVIWLVWCFLLLVPIKQLWSNWWRSIACFVVLLFFLMYHAMVTCVNSTSVLLLGHEFWVLLSLPFACILLYSSRDMVSLIPFILSWIFWFCCSLVVNFCVCWVFVYLFCTQLRIWVFLSLFFFGREFLFCRLFLLHCFYSVFC